MLLDVEAKKAQNPGTFEVWLCPKPTNNCPAQALAPLTQYPKVNGPAMEPGCLLILLSCLGILLLRPSHAWPPVLLTRPCSSPCWAQLGSLSQDRH